MMISSAAAPTLTRAPTAAARLAPVAGPAAVPTAVSTGVSAPALALPARSLSVERLLLRLSSPGLQPVHIPPRHVDVGRKLDSGGLRLVPEPLPVSVFGSRSLLLSFLRLW